MHPPNFRFLFRIYFVAALLALIAFSSPVAQAQDVAGTELAQPNAITIPLDVSDWTKLIPLLIAPLMPILLGWVKKQLIREEVLAGGQTVLVLPKWFPKWLPLFLGPALIWLAYGLVMWIGGEPGLSPWLIMLISPLPTFVREIGDQFRKYWAGDSNPVVKLIPLPPGYGAATAAKPLSPTDIGESNR